MNKILSFLNKKITFKGIELCLREIDTMRISDLQKNDLKLFEEYVQQFPNCDYEKIFNLLKNMAASDAKANALLNANKREYLENLMKLKIEEKKALLQKKENIKISKNNDRIYFIKI